MSTARSALRWARQFRRSHLVWPAPRPIPRLGWSTVCSPWPSAQWRDFDRRFSGQVLSLTGTPTTAGTYSLSISGSDAGFTSPDFEYTVIVTGGSHRHDPVDHHPALCADRHGRRHRGVHRRGRRLACTHVPMAQRRHRSHWPDCRHPHAHQRPDGQRRQLHGRGDQYRRLRDQQCRHPHRKRGRCRQPTGDYRAAFQQDRGAGFDGFVFGDRDRRRHPTVAQDGVAIEEPHRRRSRSSI